MNTRVLFYAVFSTFFVTTHAAVPPLTCQQKCLAFIGDPKYAFTQQPVLLQEPEQQVMREAASQDDDMRGKSLRCCTVLNSVAAPTCATFLISYAMANEPILVYPTCIGTQKIYKKFKDNAAWFAARYKEHTQKND